MSGTVKHVLVALGVGAASALALIPSTGPINWRQVIVAAAQAVLTALGVGAYSRRQAK